MDNNLSFISDIDDNNIFHILTFDIIPYYNQKYKQVSIYKDNINIKDKCQKWRRFVLEKLYDMKVNYTINKNLEQEQKIELYDCWKFYMYNPHELMVEIYNKICSHQKGEYILLNQRNPEKRYLYDYNSKLSLQNYLINKNMKLPFKYCYFDDLNVKEQYDICSKAAVFISVHNAGCTNLIFTPPTTPIIEVNFRKHWYCDPICDDHFYNNISINKKCNGTTVSTEFHKADYHNLCYLINKKYIEIQAVEYAGKFVDRNPINKKRIYVNGDELVNIINSLL